MVDVAVVDRDRASGDTHGATVTAQAEAVADLEVGDLDGTLERHIGNRTLTAVETTVDTTTVNDGKVVPALLGEVGVPTSGDTLVLVLVVEHDGAVEHGATGDTNLLKLLGVVDSGLEILTSLNIHWRNETKRVGINPVTLS